MTPTLNIDKSKLEAQPLDFNAAFLSVSFGCGM